MPDASSVHSRPVRQHRAGLDHPHAEGRAGAGACRGGGGRGQRTCHVGGGDAARGQSLFGHGSRPRARLAGPSPRQPRGDPAVERDRGRAGERRPPTSSCRCCGLSASVPRSWRRTASHCLAPAASATAGRKPAAAWRRWSRRRNTRRCSARRNTRTTRRNRSSARSGAPRSISASPAAACWSPAWAPACSSRCCRRSCAGPAG